METNDAAEIVIHPAAGKKERRLPPTALLLPNPAEAAVAQELFLGGGGRRRTWLASQLSVDEDRGLCLAGPCLGAPAAVLLLEKLVALGVRSVMLFSCCGSIHSGMPIGTTVLPSGGVVGEGVTHYYSGETTVTVDPAVLDRLRTFLAGFPEGWDEGVLWSTDAPYRERRDELASLARDHGVVGVDMEFTALCSVAAFRGVSFGALLVVSDELFNDQWRPGFGKPAYRERSRLWLERLLEALAAGEVFR